jgi:NADH:ubiquinone oxidoreductase subunit 6 (subunit J)
VIRVIFGIISTLGLVMALGTVLVRNLVHAALFLVAFFFLVACQFVLLEAEFLAAMQVLVYIGAVAILLMFGIMLTRNIQGDETTGGTVVGKVAAGVVGLGVLWVLVVGIAEEAGRPDARGVGRPAWRTVRVRPEAAPLGAAAADPRGAAINNMAKAVGDELMTRFAVPFEIAGLLLTAALVGAIALAQGEGPEESPRLGSRRTTRGGTTDGNGSADGTSRPAPALSNPSGPSR